MIPVSQLIDEWQRDRFLIGRQCRILQRIKALVERHHVIVSPAGLHEIGLHFSCLDEEGALAVGKALGIDVELQWIGHTATKAADYRSDDLIFRFAVPIRRTIRYEECTLAHAKRRTISGWRRCKLMFRDYELTAHNFPTDCRWTQSVQENIKKQLWSVTLTYQSQGRFPNYDFSAPF
jgi:hypothetical protein